MNPDSEKVYLVETPLGLLLLNNHMEASKVLHFINVDRGRKLIKSLKTGKLDPEVINFLEDSLKNGSKLISEELELVRTLKTDWGEKVVFEAPSDGGRWARDHPEKVALFFSKLERDMLEIAKEFALKDAEEEVARISTDREKNLIEAVKTYDTITESLNELNEKFKDWCELIWPDLLKSFKSYETALNFIASYDASKRFDLKQLIDIEPNKLKRMELVFEKAKEIPSSSVISIYAKLLLNMMDFRNKVARHIETIVEEISPNVSAVAGPNLAARLITRAGGVLELAKLSSSTIQVIGAEKALFRALRLGTRPPKHGIIFQHPLVHSSQRKFRGKIARVLASKISLAARVDAFRGEDVSEKLKKELKIKVDEIRRGDHT